MIEKLDKNFIQPEYVESDNKRSYTIPCNGFDLYGIFYDEAQSRFMRMDAKVAERVSEGVSRLATHTSGGRIRFCTDSSTIGISAYYSVLTHMPHMPHTGSSGFSLVEKIGNTYKTVFAFRPQYTSTNGFSAEATINKKGKHEYILFFPLYNDVTKLEIHLDKTAHIYKAEKYRDIKPILYYGASIEQGGCASRPDCSYPAMLSKWNNIDFINLGFSGNAMGEPLMAEYLTKIDCSMCFIAYDGNAPTPEFLEETHFNFYKIYRSVKNDIPIVFMSVPCFDNFGNANHRREIIRNSYLKAKEQGDKNIYFLDGEILFGDNDREICTVEGIHPNDLGFYRIAQRIYALYEEINSMFV